MRIKKDPFKIKPLFANEVMISCEIKGTKDEKEAEGIVRFMFTDALGNVIDEVILTRNTAKALLRILSKNLEILDQKMKEFSEKGFKLEEIKQTDKTEYIT